MKKLTLAIASLLLVGCGSSIDLSGIKQAPWFDSSHDANKAIAQTLTNNRVRGCNHYRFKPVAQDNAPGDQLWVQCSTDDTRWYRDYLVSVENQELVRLGSQRQVAQLM